MLHRIYLILLLLSVFIISPQTTTVVFAEKSLDESVFDNIKNQDTTENNNENSTVDNNQEVEDVSEVETSDISVSAFDFIKMFGALAFVLALIYFLLKFVTKRNRLSYQGQGIVNMGGTSIGQSKSIQMIKVGKRILVVGVGESITLLKEIDDDEESRDLIEEFERKQDQMIEPKDIINKVTTIISTHKKNQPEQKSSQTFSLQFNEQLKKLKEERAKQLEDVKRKGLGKHE